MPEATVAAPPSPAAPQPAAPTATQSTAPAGTPTQVTDPAIASAASEAFGAPAGTGRPEPASVTEFEEAQGPVTASPQQSGQPAETTAPPVAPGAEPAQPVVQPNPGDDFLKELEGILPPDAAPVQAVQEPDFAKPLELDKITNPDGKADLATQFKNAQSYIGKLHQQSGDTFKSLRQQLGELTQHAPAIQKLFSKDSTGQLRANAKGILDVSRLCQPHEIDAALAEQGVKLVPINAKLEQGDDPVVAAWEAEWANTVLPGNDLTLEEKLTQIKDNEKLSRRMTVDQSKWEARREAQAEGQRQQATQRQQAEATRDQELVNGFMAQLKSKPDYATFWLPAVKRANAMTDPSVKGQARLQHLNLIMQALRFPSVMKDAVAKAKEAGRNEAFGLRSMGAIPASGEQPDLTTGDLETAAAPGQPSGDSQKAATAFGARAGRI